MLRRIMLALGALAFSAAIAYANPIEGNFRMPSGNDAKIAPCGSEFCITYINGPHKGKRFGTFNATGGGNYEGSITDYTDGERRYRGKARLAGRNLVVSGCVLGGLICRDQTLNRL